MDSVVFFSVLAAALMHASWNALVKGGSDRFAFMIVLTLAECVLGVALYFFFPRPDPACLPWLLASAVLHVGYMLFLTEAYAHGDLAQVYPLSRGSAPMIVAVVGALFLGEDIGPTKVVAVLCIGLGVMVMSLRGGADFGRIPPRALAFALGTACFTASYTIVDALGARASHSASAYTSAMFALSGAGLVAAGFVRRGRLALSTDARTWRTGSLAGVLSFLAYWVAIWAFTQAPVALVAALRETSVLMAMLIGVVFMGERGGRWRWSAACLIAAGVGLMRL
ncbi:MAG: EamA family transporter [Beijerinckiaceae bacterium]